MSKWHKFLVISSACIFMTEMLIAGETVKCTATDNSDEEAKAIYITRMDKCQPSKALSDRTEQGKWQVISYETEKLKGTMVGARSGINAPDLTVPLNVSGWHKIYIAYWNAQFHHNGNPILKYKLSDQPAFRLILPPPSVDTQDATHLQEIYFDCQDLTGRDLVLGKSNTIRGKKAYYAYIKLVPIGPEEVQQIKKDRADTSTRNLVATIDGVTFFHISEFTTAPQILELVELYRNSDVAKVLWAVNYGDRTNYPTKVKNVTYNPKDFRVEGTIAQQVAADYVHSMDKGIKFDLMFRMGILGHVPRKPDSKGIVTQHPEFRQMLRDGTILEKASYAFPEVRQLMLDLIRESTNLIDADGINLCFVRGPHLLWYEKPILDAFQAKYGQDARKVDPKDPRLLEVRASFMTDFLRQTRKILDEIGAKKGKRLELSVWAWPHDRNVWLGKTPAEEGLDIPGWIKEGLIDSLICQDAIDKEYLQLCKEHNCKYINGYSFGDIRGETGFKPENIAKAYAAGVEDFVYWDIDCYQIRPERWPWISRVGHRDEIENWNYDTYKTKAFRLHKVDGVDVLKGMATAVYSGG